MQVPEKLQHITVILQVVSLHLILHGNMFLNYVALYP